MATQTCWAGEAPAINASASFNDDDSMSTKIELDNNEFSGIGLPRIVGNSDALRGVLDMVQVVGPTDATVLIQGKRGLARN